jgi:ribosomal subunit interface protein
MKIVVTGKQIDVGEALRTHISDRLNAGLSKYFDDEKLGVTVTVTREGAMFRADCTLHAGHDVYLQSRGEAADVYLAFDAAADRMEKRLRRFKRRLRDHHKARVNSETEAWRAASYVLAPHPEDDESEEGEVNGWQPMIVAETTMDIPELTVGEAVMRLDLADLPAMMFRNRMNGHFNVVFRRDDGNIGWIDPANRQTGS